MKTNTILQGDALVELKKLPDESVDCVITSPPYWGLRDYGTATWEGGDKDCKHIEKTNKHGGTSNRPGMEAQTYEYKDVCKKCGAKRIDAQLGLEKTPEEYTENLVRVFREVKRVLKKEGTAWLNLGDSYVSGKSRYSSSAQTLSGKERGEPTHQNKPDLYRHEYLKDKDLCGIPWRVAFALQADGWWLRQDIVWAKPNPMPESVTDRCTKSHEYIFLLTKSPRYYFDNEAIKEPLANKDRTNFQSGSRSNGENKDRNDNDLSERSKGVVYEKRNKRSVWTITTKPFKEAHFATFPEKLIEPMVKSGSPERGIVLDIFMGSGTTAVVAHKLGRKWLGIELNPEYIDIANKRLAPLLAQDKLL